MFGRMESGKKTTIGEDARNGRLLHEIEALSKAFNLNRNPPPKRALPSAPPSNHRSVSVGKTHFPEPPKSKPTRVLKENPSQKDKKSSSIWSWKPLKALSHVRNRRFNCRFSLQVHSIEGLQSDFDGVCLIVHWRRREGGLETRPARVFHGIAEFEETLSLKCSVYGSRSGQHHSAKYEAKHFLVSASVVGAPDLDLGKHRVDLTRLLPITLEELEEEKSSGKWTTSFKLTGKAKGAILNVSFGYLVLGDDAASSSPGTLKKTIPEISNSKQNRVGAAKPMAGRDAGDARAALRRVGSLPGVIHGPQTQSRIPSRSVEDVTVLHEVLRNSRSEVSGSADVEGLLTYWKLNEGSIIVDSKPECEVLFSEPGLISHSLSEPGLISYSLSEPVKDACENYFDDAEFTVIERGIEIATKDPVKVEEDTNDVGDIGIAENVKTDEIDKGEYVTTVEVTETDQGQDVSKSHEEEFPPNECDSKKNISFTKDLVLDEINSALCNLSVLEAEELDSPRSPSDSTREVSYIEVKPNYEKGKMRKSLSFDDMTESVASEFLTMLGVEHSPFGLSSDSDPDSPRGRLLKQFEKESLAGGIGLFGLDIGTEREAESVNDSVQFDLGELSKEFELSTIVQAAETEHQKASQAIKSKTRAKMLEDAEAEALMQEWGLNENSFQSSAPRCSGGFGSPIHLPPEEPFDLPPLGEGLGPFVQTNNGGFLRSMNPSLFKNAKNNGSLIMQVSSPVVVPAEMGSGIMDILQGLASVGIEKLSMQAGKLMPLEDITGKTMQQVAWEAAPALEARERQDSLHGLKHEGLSDVRQDAFSGRRKGKSSSGLNASSGDMGSEYVSLEDLAPLAMDKIEALSIEGLRIQTGMSNEEAPSNISPQSIGEVSALEGLRAKSRGSLGLEGAAGLQLLDIKDGGEDVDGLMGLSITLDEWMRLDAGIVDEEEQNSSRTSKILAAHHASCTDLVNGGWKGDRKGGKGSGKRCGLLGNNFTVALMVQLRDPLRNYEPVGTPMLALIQVERVFVPPKPKIYCNVSMDGNSEEADEPEPVLKEEKVVKEEVVPQFKITEVHVAGLKTEPGKKKLWGNTTQQQSGSRWLLASGMGKSNKHPFMKSKTVSKSPQATTTVQPGDTLWSISSRVHGTGAKWKELAALNPHIRNPNVIFPNETIRLQ